MHSDPFLNSIAFSLSNAFCSSSHRDMDDNTGSKGVIREESDKRYDGVYGSF